MSAKLKTVTLGCKVNQYETELVREGLTRAGFEVVDENEPADLCVVNTCTVTAEGDSKSRQMIRRLNRQNPDARIVVMGCYATRDPGAVSQLPGVAEVVTDKREIPDLLGRFGVIDVPNGISGISNRHRAFVKIQDGCLLKCTYCIIPTVRPNMYSRDPDEILAEIQNLINNGLREIVLTGIHLGHFGVDFNIGKPKCDWVRLSHLLEKICRLQGEFRVRLSSIEATEVTRELIAVMKSNSEKICPHLHVCLQSGSDKILSRMKRRWSRKHIIDRCKLIKEELELPAFSTDVIVGFPGESDSDFADTLDACRQIGFSKIHMFPFSARKTTPAAEMNQQISKAIKSERGRRIAELEAELRSQYFDQLIGRNLDVLIENTKLESTVVTGTSCRYAKVSFRVQDSMKTKLEGQMARVEITDNVGTHLNGKLIGSKNQI